MHDQWASISTDGRQGHLLIHMQLETQAPGGGGALVSSYCCSTYRVAEPFSSLGNFSSSFIGGPVIHPIDDCEHPLLCLLGPGIVSQETAISGSLQQNLGSFQLLAIINKAAMNIVEHVSLLPVGTSSGYMPRRGFAGSSGSTMSNFLRNHQADFQSGCTSLQSYQQWRSVPFFSTYLPASAVT